jgi:iron complex outermembrane recepter protein
MKRWWLLGNFNLSLLISLLGCLSATGIQPGLAEEKSASGQKISPIITSEIPQLSEIQFPAKSVTMLGKTPTPTNPLNPDSSLQGEKQGGIVTITGVKANPTEKGVEIILETTQGDKLQVTNRSANNNFIADIAGGQLRLPSGDVFTFKSEKPISGIIEITVTNIDANTVRVTVIGEKALPVVELFDDNAGLIFTVASTSVATQPPEKAPTQEKPVSEASQEKPDVQQDNPIELLVTGERDSYRAPNASTATRTDTPIRDIPQSIQVVPQEVLRDRNVRTLTEAVETVSGVVDAGGFYGAPAGGRIIRGFDQSGNFRNGYRDSNYGDLTGIGIVEQVEVLKGPASVLFGQVEPGGIINTVTKQPLSTPYYKLGLEAGNYGYYQPSVDFSGHLDVNKNILYRFIASYQSSNSIQPFFEPQLTTIAPSMTLNLGDKTKLNLYYEYVRYFANDIRTDAVVKSDGSLTPRDFYVGYPNLNLLDITSQRFGYALSHEFNDNWKLRNNLAVTSTKTIDERVYGIGLVDDRFIQLEFADYGDSYKADNYFGQIDLLGKFKTGSISHQLLIGFDFNRLVNPVTVFQNFNIPDLDILNPNYGFLKPETVPTYKADSTTQSYGVYLQDQISFADNLKLLIGGRYDWISYDNEIADFGLFGNTIDDPVQNNGAFSPRIGLVYQPSKSISLYASYTRSFVQSAGFNSDGRAFEPTRGTQYEVGVKSDFLDGRLSTTLAAYQITKTNVVTTDLSNPLFSIQTGEQRSQGIELDVAGEVLPGLKLIASYAYTNAEVTKDNSIPVGNKLRGVPENQASLWTTYEIQKGNLRGLGFGLGLFYVGERQGNEANSFQVDSYLRTDAALFYRRDGFNAAINIRNLFDTDYVSTPFRQSAVQRGAPFTIIGSISWEF